MARRKAFTLVELLVVIAVIALLLAIFIPALGRARELGQRAVCLSNLRQLTLAWLQYAEDNGGKLVLGSSSLSPEHVGWISYAFHRPESRSALWEDPRKGLLWPYLRNIDIYRCPRGRRGHASTYGIVGGANGSDLNAGGTNAESYQARMRMVGLPNQVGKTVLRLMRLSDIISPGASERAVFTDTGQGDNGFLLSYFEPEWHGSSPPPIHHAGGVTLSFVDAHAEYWKWSRETLSLPRVEMIFGGLSYEYPPRGADLAPKTEEGLYDLQRMQKAIWGRLGYSPEAMP
jgi:prepilin-type N-terminal cleavage/methylation domain-containing protein